MSKQKQTRPMFPSIYFYAKDVKKYVYGKKYIEVIIDTLNKDKTFCIIEGSKISVVSNSKTDKEWDLEVVIEELD